MAFTITANTLDKQYDDLEITPEAVFDAAFNSLLNFQNTQMRQNLLQLAKECHGNGADATFDGDGVANFTNTLYNKQNGSVTYDGGNVNLGLTADGAYADADAANLKIDFTPERVGFYKVSFGFTHLIILTAITEGQCEVSFRMTDGTSFSPSVRSGGYLPATAANNGRLLNPVSLQFLFNWADTAAKTIKLQKFVRAGTAVNTNQVSAAAATGEFYAIVEKI